MASIIQDNKQLEALNNINTGIATVRDINTLLAGANDYSIGFANERGRSTKVTVSGKTRSKICAALVSHKAKIIKDVLSMAEKYHINISDEEMAILNASDAPASDAKPQEPQRVEASLEEEPNPEMTQKVLKEELIEEAAPDANY